MSLKYVAVRWNRNKRTYDKLILTGIALYLVLFYLVGKLVWRGNAAIDDVILLIRALGTCAFLMLNIVLCIGPLARLDRRFLPLLFNRRHLGVATFLVGLAHALLTLGYYHGFGRINPFLSLLVSNRSFNSWTAFPFELLGLAALVILFFMAVTSHDFWQKNLGPSVWKGLHMLVYLAYALLVMHIALGALQGDTRPVYPVLLGLVVTGVVGLHAWTGCREFRRDTARSSSELHQVGENQQDSPSRWIDIGSIDEISENRAKTVCLPGCERIAVFRFGDQVSAMTNVCAHQRGPLSEGKIVEGCITCPWHGWQYRPQDGRSPPPFEEKIATFRVRIDNRRILLDPRPLPPGTATEPARIEGEAHDPTCIRSN